MPLENKDIIFTVPITDKIMIFSLNENILSNEEMKKKIDTP